MTEPMAAQQADAEVEEFRNQVERLIGAINWACGCGYEGVEPFDPYVSAKTGEMKPRYWWREPLTEIGGLTWDREKLCYVSRATSLIGGE